MESFNGNFSVLLLEEAKEDLRDMDGAIKRRILKELKKLQIAPKEYGLPLRGELHGFYKLRVGDYRVVYRVDEEKKYVICLIIQHRRQVYQEARKRIK